MHTVDAIVMALILFASLGVAYSIAPSGGDVDERMAEQQLESDGEDLIEISAQNGTLEDSILYWDDSAGKWLNSGSNGEYVVPPDDHPLNTTISILENRGLSYGITVEYVGSSGQTEQTRMVHQGAPNADPVVISETITIQNEDNLVGPDSDTTVENSSSFYAPNAFDSSTYNIITIRVLIWK